MFAEKEVAVVARVDLAGEVEAEGVEVEAGFPDIMTKSFSACWNENCHPHHLSAWLVLSGERIS